MSFEWPEEKEASNWEMMRKYVGENFKPSFAVRRNLAEVYTPFNWRSITGGKTHLEEATRGISNVTGDLQEIYAAISSLNAEVYSQAITQCRQTKLSLGKDLTELEELEMDINKMTARVNLGLKSIGKMKIAQHLDTAFAGDAKVKLHTIADGFETLAAQFDDALQNPQSKFNDEERELVEGMSDLAKLAAPLARDAKLPCMRIVSMDR